MSRESIHLEFSLLVGNALALLVAFLLLLFVPAARAAQNGESDPYTRALIRGLDNSGKAALRRSFQKAFVRVHSGEQSGVIPAHILHHTLFLDLLLKPGAMAGLPPADRQIINSLPAHDDARFAEEFHVALANACRVIGRLPIDSPAAATQASRAFQQAQRKMDARLDRHYEEVLGQLSSLGRALVTARMAEIDDGDSLVYTTLDLNVLSFSEPAFLLAFLKDTCINSEQIHRAAKPRARALRDQLGDDFDRGGVQFYQPQ